VKGVKGRVLAATIAAAGTFALAAPAQAAPPANDNFASAQPISAVPSTIAGTLAESTIESPDEQNPSGSMFVVPTQSVWYSWTSPATTSKVKFTACPSPITGSTPGVAIYTGSALNALTLVTTTGPNTVDSESDCSVKLVAAPSTTYKIVLWNKHSSFNPVTLGAFQLQLRALNPPANDDFEDAIAISSTLPQTIQGTNVDATGETGEPNHFFPPSTGARASVWYTWTAPAGGPIRINACSNTGPAPTVIAVYTGAGVASLTPIAWFQSCRDYFDAIDGQTYRLAADILCGNCSESPFSMIVRRANPPANDDLADAQVIPGDTIENVVGSTFDATTEPGEPNHIVPSGGPPGPPDAGPPLSVWYQWTSGAGGPMTINACNGPSAGSVAVYTGETYLDPLALIAGNGNCAVQFTAAPSTSYKIAIESLGDGGPIVLNPPPAPPAPPSSPGGGNSQPPVTSPGPTGQRAKALKKCKKKRGKARKKCVKRAKRRPV
jgi:hypothetical protein